MSMSNLIEYKNYLAELNLDTDDNIIVGRVINTTEIISFHGKTIREAKKAFHDVLDTYLITCEEEDIEPSLPTSGKFSLRVDPKLHGKLRDHAKMADKSLNEFIVGILKQKIDRLEHREAA